MRWGGEENEKFFKAVYEGEGRHHHALLQKPALRGDCIRYYDAFRSLGAARIWSPVGPQPIPVSEVESYLNLAGITSPHTRLKYLRLIRAMDQVELTHLHQKQQKQKQT